MGIKDFFKIVHDDIPIESLGKEIDLKELEGKNICIGSTVVVEGLSNEHGH